MNIEEAILDKVRRLPPAMREAVLDPLPFVVDPLFFVLARIIAAESRRPFKVRCSRRLMASPLVIHISYM